MAAARNDGVEHARKRLRAQPKQARLVLVDLDADLPGRLDPVEIDVRDLRICGDDLRQLQRDVAHLRNLRATDAVLDRPSDRRAQLQRRDTADEAGELIGQQPLELRLQAVACGHVLGDDDSLAEEVVWKLHVERQIEPDCTAADVGAPARNVRIVLQDIVKTARHGLAGEDRGILGQRQVDEQFGPVRGREELIGNERKRED